MKQCPNCGNSIEQRAMICNNCGVNFSGDGDRGGRQSNQEQNRQPRQEQNRQPRQGHVGQGQQAAGAQSGTSQTLSGRIASLGITRITTLAAGVLLLIAAAFLPYVTGDGQLSASATETEFGTPILIAGGAILGFSAVRWGRGIGWITMLLSGVAGAGAVVISVLALQTLSTTEAVRFQVVIVRGSRVPINAVEPGVGVFVTIVAGGLAVVGSLFGIIDSITDY